MADYDYDLGIIGGGAAGLTVASGAAQLGAKTLLVEKEAALGGDCLHYGCVPSKTLIKTAHVYHLMKNGPKFGLPAITPPEVDFRQVAARIQSVISVIQKHDSVARFCKLGAQVEFGNPVFTDEHAMQLGGKSISARAWVIATGSSATIPPIAGLATTPYLTNRDIFSLERLPATLIILGCGPISVEMAQAFCRLGSKVTVIQRSDQILSKEDRDMAEIVQQALEEEGVTFLLNTSVVRVADLGNEREVVVKNAAGVTTRLKGEAILVAMGRSPNVAGLGLEKIDVPFDQRGIAVNRSLRTSHRHIYAAGDVIGGYQFTHVAGYEGGVVLSKAIFHLPKKVDYSLVPWCTYTHPGLASIGLNEKRAQKAGIDYTVWSEEFSNNDRGLAEGESVGRIKLLLGRRGKPLGVQILGPQAGELLGEWVAVMNGGMSLSKIASAIHPYPTLGEINKRVVGSIFSKKIFSAPVRKGLKFFFGFRGPACK
ncbi:dihydrolipoyl dehydrogenase family protein [Thiovibrio frasassiensis]|uniref:FAD-dependent oxidoreductase n=1 Tax=Thiovibrio frasassiensis TaxID=2984131 RepID=A0A9X4MHC0_9BACT|nr:FAD-dependent oxidoreductase [Thiovibrio frasassiensis]MDG4475855.1 FAD-dependent oxidoreductase [Thiovibrio frasassiensis]